MVMYKYGVFKVQFVAFVTLIIVVLVIYVGIIRDRSYKRDKTYWNKLDFMNDGKLSPNVSADVVATIAAQQQQQLQQAGCATGSTGPRGPTGPVATMVSTGSTGGVKYPNYNAMYAQTLGGYM